MNDRDRQPRGRHLLLYDGGCGFCHRAVRFVLAHDRRAVFRFAALQSEPATVALARFGGRPADLTTFYVIERYAAEDAVLHRRGDAMLLVADALGWPWQAASILRLLPRAWRDAAYDLVARRRHRIAGKAEACLVPPPEDRARFLDANETQPR